MQFTAQSLSQRLLELGLVQPEQLDQVWSAIPRKEQSLDNFIQQVLRKELVTNFQLERVLAGERQGYFYGKYKVLYMIGAGTFARVYRSAHVDTKKVVAVKVLRMRHREDPEQVEQFLREGQMGMQLRHPNIVSIYEIVGDPRAPYLVMEFVEGQTLRELMAVRRRLEPLAAMRIVRDVVAGLDAALKEGITHRDMKLSNVLVSASGRCKLVDFGLAAIAKTDTPDELADCPNARAIDYAALERATGVRKDDSRSDLYFAGVILYHMLSGVAPLTETRDRLARLNVSRFREVKPLGALIPSLPANVLTVCSRAMELDPKRRYQSPAEMLSEIRSVIERLEAGDTTTVSQLINRQVSQGAVDAEAAKEGDGKVVMVVESRLEMQDLLRERLRSRGYRVLVTSNPQRALQIFTDQQASRPDCVIFSATDLGGQALDAFNELGQQTESQSVPAILIIDREQEHVLQRARLGPYRVILMMPLKVRQLREVLAKLLGHSEVDVRG